MRKAVWILSVLIAFVTSPVWAQTVIDPQRVEFDPSADHAAVTPDGLPIVDHYTLAVFRLGGLSPDQSADLGKPPLDADGKIRVALATELLSALTPDVTYEARVSAVGPTGSGTSDVSNPFALSLPTVPVDCVVSDWSCTEWSLCDATGIQAHVCTRTVTTPSANGGIACPVDLTKTETQACTPPPEGDTTAPTVTTLTIRQNGKSKNYGVTSQATDDIGVARMDIALDGRSPVPMSFSGGVGSATLSISAPGEHTITVRAFDGAGNVSVPVSRTFVR